MQFGLISCLSALKHFVFTLKASAQTLGSCFLPDYCDLRTSGEEPLVTIFLHSCTSLSAYVRQAKKTPKQRAFDTLSLKEKYINDAPWQSALIRGGSPWTQLFIGHRFSSGFMASDTPRKLVAGRLLGNTLRGCQLSRYASCIIL